MRDYNCVFEVWNDKEKKMKPCGEKGAYYKVTPCKRTRELKINGRELCLCPDHFNFVKDSVNNIHELKEKDEQSKTKKQSKKFSVWVVTSTSDYSDIRIECIFWSKKKAQEFIKKASPDRVYDFEKRNVL